MATSKHVRTGRGISWPALIVGIGLGLAISDSIIKYHNGLITVESLVGVGTTFMVYLSATPNDGKNGKAS